MGKHEEISEQPELRFARLGRDPLRLTHRAKVRATNHAVTQIIYDAAVFSSLPENVKADIAIDGH